MSARHDCCVPIIGHADHTFIAINFHISNHGIYHGALLHSLCCLLPNNSIDVLKFKNGAIAELREHNNHKCT